MIVYPTELQAYIVRTRAPRGNPRCRINYEYCTKEALYITLERSKGSGRSFLGPI